MPDRIEITRPLGTDGLARHRWVFHCRPHCGEVALVLVGFGTQRRKTSRGRWSDPRPAERWDWMDERRYNSGLNRPIKIPDGVLAEAVVSIKPVFYIGWTNEESRYDA